MNIPAELSIRAINSGVFIAKGTTITRLIRRIQSADGDDPCFRTDLRDHCQKRCEWADQCKCALVARWQR